MFVLPSKARNGVSSLAWYLGCWYMDDGAQHGCHNVETFRAVGGRGDAGVESEPCRKMCVLCFSLVLKKMGKINILFLGRGYLQIHF